MKKTFVLLIMILAFLSCKNDSKNNTEKETSVDEQKVETKDIQQDEIDSKRIGLQTLGGDFIYFADAAVLQTEKEVYGVVINEKMHELDNLAKKHKKEPTDMVPVVIKGNITAKPEKEEGWPFRVEILEIIKVSEPDPNQKDVIKLGKK